MTKILVAISITLLLILNVIALQIHFDMQDTKEYLDAIYFELSLCKDLTDEHFLSTQ